MAGAPPAASLAATLAGGMAAAAETVSAALSGSKIEDKANDSQASIRQYLADSPPTVVRLEVGKNFDQLSEQLKWYAHHLSRASWSGTRIIARQISPESEAIYTLILELHRACAGEWRSLQARAKLTDGELQHFLHYAAQFFGYGGNYVGFGDTKILPRLPVDRMATLAAVAPEAQKIFVEKLGGTDSNLMYFDALRPGFANLGYRDEGHVSEYYPDSADITSDEIKRVSEFLAAQGVLPENTRLTKTNSGDFMVRMASVSNKAPANEFIDAKNHAIEWNNVAEVGGKRIWLEYGDYSNELQQVAYHLREAMKYARDDRQRSMLEHYALSFETGSMNSLKESQKLWVKDIGPPVESNIGFVETYRDPAGLRAEWEGFVAIVNVERTKAFSKLVASAEPLISKLPWGPDFELSKFNPPDFSSLEVVTCAGSGPPAGINIPNYDDIRKVDGFKNVSFGNVLSAKAPSDPMPFVAPADRSILERHRDPAFEVQVGLHELLGHGSGKLLQETKPGEFNFDRANPPISPITKKAVTSWYGPDQTFSSVFGPLSPPFEECRAECVAMSLCCEWSVLAIFGFGDGTPALDGEPGDVLHAAYLTMARAGLLAVKYFDVAARKWGQAHMQARFAILQVWLRAGGGLVRLEHEATGEEVRVGDASQDLSDLVVRVDRSKIMDVGRPAVDDFLTRLQVLKATADIDGARALFDDFTAVDSVFWGGAVRKAVLDRDVPRKIFVQANTFVRDGKVEIVEYEASSEGMIQSFAERNV